MLTKLRGSSLTLERESEIANLLDIQLNVDKDQGIVELT